LFVTGDDFRLGHHLTFTRCFQGRQFGGQEKVSAGKTDGKSAGAVGNPEIHHQCTGVIDGGLYAVNHRIIEVDHIGVITRNRQNVAIQIAFQVTATPADTQLFLQVRLGDDDTRLNHHLSNRDINQVN